ncbi:galactoside alpha-(1,2)-fucosyltransferase 2-like [Littorina saxatilis]|uniref:L-Fucosyltransferase n=1 Tax=Littorina saxatilis TaxID=31220 RepID=A0AAN9B294_9CAEN
MAFVRQGRYGLFRVFVGVSAVSSLFLALFILTSSQIPSRIFPQTVFRQPQAEVSRQSLQKRDQHNQDENRVSVSGSTTREVTTRKEFEKENDSEEKRGLEKEKDLENKGRLKQEKDSDKVSPKTPVPTVLRENSQNSSASKEEKLSKPEDKSTEPENKPPEPKVKSGSQKKAKKANLQKSTETATPTTLTTTPQVKNGTFWVTVRPGGRMGNHLFMYASLLGIAARNNLTHSPFFPKTALTGSFNLNYHNASRSTRNFTVMGEKFFGSYDSRFERLPKKNVVFAGYLQSWKYFHHIRSTIFREFRFKDGIRRKALTLIEKAVKVKGKVNATRVGVHVRRSDMLNRAVLQSGFKSPPVSFYKKAASYFREKYSDVIFIIVTDGPGWCNENLASDDVVVADKAGPETHLALLTLCDHVISSVGTFGWWGGYLSGGDVVYYKHQIIPMTFRARNIAHADYFLPNWVGIGD